VEELCSVDRLAAAPMTVEDRRERLAALFDAHHGRLDRLARRLSGGSVADAEDLVQEVFLRVARRPGAVPDGGSAEEAWLVRVLVNLCRDRWRRRLVRERTAGELGHAEASTSATPPETLDARRRVAAGLARLSPRRRAILVLAELEGRDSAEIGRLLGLAAVTVRWHLTAARRAFAAAVAELGRTTEEDSE
jgi:RNA polymerase sigma factor (sigma-70 family)